MGFSRREEGRAASPATQPGSRTPAEHAAPLHLTCGAGDPRHVPVAGCHCTCWRPQGWLQLKGGLQDPCTKRNSQSTASSSSTNHLSPCSLPQDRGKQPQNHQSQPTSARPAQKVPSLGSHHKHGTEVGLGHVLRARPQVTSSWLAGQTCVRKGTVISSAGTRGQTDVSYGSTLHPGTHWGATALGASPSASYYLSAEQTLEAQSSSRLQRPLPEPWAAHGAKAAMQTFHQCPQAHRSHGGGMRKEKWGRKEEGRER